MHDFNRASDFRYATLRFIRESLGLHEVSGSYGCLCPKDLTALLESESIIIHSFEDVDRAVSEFGSGRLTNGRLTARFYEALEVFVKTTELMQKVEFSGKLPTLSEYLERLMGSSGVHVCLALTTTHDTSVSTFNSASTF